MSDTGARHCKHAADLLITSSMTNLDVGTQVLKCKEGLNNKAYLLTMDNNTEIFAKLPNPCAGPSFYTTASEVGTRKFVSAYLKPGNRDLLYSC